MLLGPAQNLVAIAGRDGLHPWPFLWRSAGQRDKLVVHGIRICQFGCSSSACRSTRTKTECVRPRGTTPSRYADRRFSFASKRRTVPEGETRRTRSFSPATSTLSFFATAPSAGNAASAIRLIAAPHDCGEFGRVTGRAAGSGLAQPNCGGLARWIPTTSSAGRR